MNPKIKSKNKDYKFGILVEHKDRNYEIFAQTQEDKDAFCNLLKKIQEEEDTKLIEAKLLAKPKHNKWRADGKNKDQLKENVPVTISEERKSLSGKLTTIVEEDIPSFLKNGLDENQNSDDSDEEEETKAVKTLSK